MIDEMMTTALEPILRLHEHRMWVNQRLISAVISLTDDQLHQEFAIGQGTVWNTLTHLAAAEYVWLEALCGKESPLFPGDLPGQIPGNQNADDALRSLPELIDCWQKLGDRWKTYLSDLSESDLNEPVYKVSTSSQLGQRTGTSRVDVLLHVCTHAQYTTAQLINMLRHVGATSLPDVMLITLARENSPP